MRKVSKLKPVVYFNRLVYDRAMANAYIRYQKYKRCQNMWLYCSAMWHRYMDAEIKERLRTGYCDSKGSNFYSRWCNKWEQLMMHFKELNNESVKTNRTRT